MFDDLPLDREGLLGELSREIGRILAAVTPDLVLSCAAVGDHIDHRLTSAAVLDAVSSTEVRTLLWEDLPYAIRRSPIMMTRSLTRTAPPEAWERKWRAIARYTSQVRMLWPADADWIAELSAHAAIRGNESPAELLLTINPTPFQRLRTWGV